MNRRNHQHCFHNCCHYWAVNLFQQTPTCLLPFNYVSLQLRPYYSSAASDGIVKVQLILVLLRRHRHIRPRRHIQIAVTVVQTGYFGIVTLYPY